MVLLLVVVDLDCSMTLIGKYLGERGCKPLYSVLRVSAETVKNEESDLMTGLLPC